MPVSLTVTVQPPRPRLRVSDDLTLWRRLHRLARATTLSLLDFWRALFADLSRALDPERPRPRCAPRLPLIRKPM